eukprot:979419_1
MLKTPSHDTSKVAEEMCAFLPPQPKEKSGYIDKYREHIQQWLLHDFYNTICSHCGNVNQSIMINRVFHYSSTVRNCRTCGVIIRASNAFKIAATRSETHIQSQSVHWFCQTRKQTLEKAGIDIKQLANALHSCAFNEQIAEHQETYLLNILLSLLHERWDELTYYLSRFLDDITGNWSALRIKITTDYYFYESSKSFVSTKQFMIEAGIHESHLSIFKDCWSRALFQYVKDNHQLITILNDLNDIDAGDDEKSNTNVNDILCIDRKRLTIFRTLTPSISAFTSRFIQKLKQHSSTLNLNLVCLIQRFLDFKIDDSVFAVIHEMEFLSLIFNKWEYLSPPIYDVSFQRNTILDMRTVSYWDHVFGITLEPKTVSYKNWNVWGIPIEPTHDTLRSELLNELHMVHGVGSMYSELHRKAQTLWNRRHKYIWAKKSRWNTITGVRAGTHISVKYIHAVLLFTEIPALRDVIRRLLARVPIIEIHKRFGHLFKLLRETVYLFGNKLEDKSTYYSLDEDIPLDKYRAMKTIPIIGSNKSMAYQQKDNHLMAECEISQRTALYRFNITSFMEHATPDQDFYIFFGGTCVIEPDIHIDRQRLHVGSQCLVYSHSQTDWLPAQVVRVFTDDEGEWLQLIYSNTVKEVKRLDGDLLVIKPDKWYDIMVHFGGDLHMDPTATTHPLVKTLTHSYGRMLKDYNIQCNPELMFRIKTVLTHYERSQNIIPDVDTFIKDTNLNVPEHKLNAFQERYSQAKAHAQKKRKKHGNRTVRTTRSTSKRHSKVLSCAFGSNFVDLVSKPVKSTLADKPYDVGIFMRYEVNNPRFESLAEETMFNEVVNISNERFNQHLAKAKEVFF